jgi:hypothetical protein
MAGCCDEAVMRVDSLALTSFGSGDAKQVGKRKGGVGYDPSSLGT